MTLIPVKPVNVWFLGKLNTTYTLVEVSTLVLCIKPKALDFNHPPSRSSQTGMDARVVEPKSDAMPSHWSLTRFLWKQRQSKIVDSRQARVHGLWPYG